jgi:site-specific recombinase XerD
MPAAAIIVLRQPPNATFAAEEFFKATLSNEHTRRADGRIAGRFLTWCDDRGSSCAKSHPASPANTSVSYRARPPQALAALRHFFDALVQRHAVALNPFASVRGVKYSITEGRMAELAIEQARKLFRSIDSRNVVGLRDRAVLGVLAYTGARIGAVARLRMVDYRNLGDHRVLRFREKGGKDREIPVRHDLAAWLNEYIAAAGIVEEPKAPPFARPRANASSSPILLIAPTPCAR